MIKEYIEENNIFLLVVKKEQYPQKIIEITRETIESIGSTCYICLTQPYTSLLETLKKNNIDVEKIRFIDVVTNSVSERNSTEQCQFISSPSALTEIGVAFSKITEKTKGAIIDSITTLLVYENENSVTRFAHSLITKTRLSGQKALFIALKEDTNSNLINDIHMFVDKVIDTEKEDENPARKAI